MLPRRKTSSFFIKNVGVGGSYPVSLQSMVSLPTVDIEAVLDQLFVLASAGCDIVRLGVPDEKSAQALVPIVKRSPLPLVADIHFDYKLALMALEAGIDALRLNPGNIQDKAKVRLVVQEAKGRSVPIRIGVNAGSLDPHKYPHPTPEALTASAWEHIKILEDFGYTDLKVSFKSSHVPTMIEANRLFASQCSYPLHLGVTEAGADIQAVVKNTLGIGTLLQEGIGDTLRVSITGGVVPEVEAGRCILRSLGLRSEGVEIISCPTCARVEYDVLEAVEQFKEKTAGIKHYIRVAIMGCIVNGPGEAREADVGIAVGKTGAALFRKGKVIGTYPKSEMLDALFAETLALVHEKEGESL